MKKENYGLLYLLNTILLFSTYEVVSKTLVGKINPFQINLIRFFIGGLVLFIFLLARRDFMIGKKEWVGVVLIGTLNVVVSMNLLQLSLYESDAKASMVAVIFSSNPIFVMIFSAILEKEKIRLMKIIGLSIGIMGIVVVLYEKLKVGSSGFRSPMLALLSALFYGLYTVLARRASVRIGSLKMNSYSFIAGSLVLLPILLIFHVPVIQIQSSSGIQIIYLAVFVSGFAYLTYFKGLTILGASRGSLVFFIKPVLAGIFAAIFLKEHITYHLLFGTAMILLGIYMAVRRSELKNS